MLKKLCARDYENLLQASSFNINRAHFLIDFFHKCSIPVFEGLLPEPHNTNVMEILFALAHWHSLAKLRQHTDLSLDVLKLATVQLGKSLRKFQKKTCTAFQTQELPREVAKRIKKLAKKSSAKSADLDDINSVQIQSTQTASSSTVALSSTKTVNRHFQGFNLKTYKDHALGDYVDSIRRYGTVDSYSTEFVSYKLV